MRISTSPVLAKAHYDQMARYFSDYGQVPARPGELCYLALSMEEPAGKPISMCRKVEVRLELTTPEDLGVLATKGLAATRQRRVSRLARQARVQAGLLTIEDLNYLLTSSPATIKRDLSALRAEGESVLQPCDAARAVMWPSPARATAGFRNPLRQVWYWRGPPSGVVKTNTLEELPRVSSRLLDEEGRNRDRSPPADRLVSST